MSEVAEILERAADMIERAPKLAKGIFATDAANLDAKGYILPPDVPARPRTERMCYCVEGAINRCADMNPGLLSRTTGAFARYIRVDPVTGIYDWNDAPERTKAEAVQALRSAARGLT